MIMKSVIALENQFSGPAKAAESATAQLRSAMMSLANAITADETRLARMQEKMRAMQMQSSVNINSYRSLKNAIEDKTQAIARSHEQYAQMGTDLESVQQGSGNALTGLVAMGGGIGLAMKAAQLAEQAISRLITSVIALGEKSLSTAVQVGELKANLTSAFASLTSSGAVGGAATLAALDKLSDKLSMTRQQVGDWGEDLASLNIKGANLTDSVKAWASAFAMMGGATGRGEAAVSKLRMLYANIMQAKDVGRAARFSPSELGGTGVTVEEFAKAMGIKTGKSFSNALKKGLDPQKALNAINSVLLSKGGQALKTWAAQPSGEITKLKDNLAKLFEGINMKPFDEGLVKFVDLFNASSASGKAMQTIVSGAFQVIFSAAAKVWPYVKNAVEDVIIVTLKLLIAMKPAIKQFKAASGSGDLLALTFRVLTQMAVGAVFAVLTLARDFMVLYVAISNTVAWVEKVVTAIKDFVKNAGKALSDWGKSGKSAASNFISGLVGGITGGASKAISAVKHLGTSLLDAISSPQSLDMHSPSRAMFKKGLMVPLGMAGGIDAGAYHVHRAAISMASAPTKATTGRSSVSNSRSLVVTGNTITIHGAGSNGEALSLTEESLGALLEKAALEQGLVA